MVLSKAAFFHNKYLTLYTNGMQSSIREFITKNRNCQDIAMSFLVANATSAPPIWVKGYFQTFFLDRPDLSLALRDSCIYIPFGPTYTGTVNEIGSTGVSRLGGHTEKGTICVNRFAAEYGKMPLVYSSIKGVDSRGFMVLVIIPKSLPSLNFCVDNSGPCYFHRSSVLLSRKDL